MDTSLFDYELPKGQIAQAPAQNRDDSKLLVVDRKSGKLEHRVFREIGDWLPARSRLFRNVAAVLRARIIGKLQTGGKVECLLLHPGETPENWWCLLKPGKKLPTGRTFGLEGHFIAEILEKNEDGQCLVRFQCEKGQSVAGLAEEIGELPLPPYIARKNCTNTPEDKERYQTVYADPEQKVAAAAPTAGLHFTMGLIDELEAQGFRFHDLLLRVGLGTFRPIQADTLEEHQMHSESYTIGQAALDALREGVEGGTRVAVGTTSVRTIEDTLRKDAESKVSAPFTSEANLFLYPPAEFLGVDALVTNFHLPRSTLLCLVSAFLTPGQTDGIQWLKEIYSEALAKGYRFYSYGDAMLIL
jgi:S-adenosylmethionine:tRNA ribosyltransferase-isomerase